MVVIGGGAVSYERGTPASNKVSLLLLRLLGGSRDRRAKLLVLSPRVLARLVAGWAHVLLASNQVGPGVGV